MLHTLSSNRRIRSALRQLSRWLEVRFPALASSPQSHISARRRSSFRSQTTRFIEALEPRTLLSAVTWTGAGDGTHWSDGQNWSTLSLPGSADDVVINAAGNPNILLDSNVGTASIHSLSSANILTISGGATLSVATTANLSANLILSSGTIQNSTITFTNGTGMTATNVGGTLDNVTLNGDIDMTVNGTSINVLNTLTLNGTATLGTADGTNAGYFWFNNGNMASSALMGNATVDLSNGTFYNFNQDGGANDGILTLGSQVTIHGFGGSISSAASSGGGNIINNGTVDADVAAGTLYVNGPFTNSSTGILKAENAGTLTIPFSGNSFINQGTIVSTGSGSTINGGAAIDNSGTIESLSIGTVALSGEMTNSGTVEALLSGTLSIAGTITLANTGTIINTNGLLDVSGILDLGGHSISLDNSWTITGGTVRNGTITQASATTLVATTHGGTLDAITFNGNIDLTQVNGVNLAINNTLTLNGTARIGSTNGANYGQLQFNTALTTSTGLSGNATVLFGGNSDNSIFNYNYNNGSVDGILRIASTVTIHGYNGYLRGWAGDTGPIQNSGLITADIAGGTIYIGSLFYNNSTGKLEAQNAATLTLNYGSTLINKGTILADGSGSLINADANISNSALIQSQNSASLYLTQLVTNSGSIKATSASTLRFSGTTTFTSTGSITNASATININGLIDLGGQTISPSGSLSMLGGTIKNGTIAESPAGPLIATNYGGLLDNIIINGDIDITQSDGASLAAQHILTVNGTILIGNTDGSNAGQLQFNSQPPNATGLAGNAIVLFGGNTRNNIFNYNYDGGAYDGVLTLASTVTVHGENGYLTNWSDATPIINNGLINADSSSDGTILIGNLINGSTGEIRAVNSATILLAYGATTTNLGLIDSDGAAATVTAYADINNFGIIKAQNSGTITLRSDNTNAGLFQATTGGLLWMGGTTLFTGPGSLTNIASTIDIVGIVDLGAQTISPTGPITILGGILQNGTVTQVGSSPILATPDGGYLNNLTVNGNLDIATNDGANLGVQNVLILNGTADIGSSDGTTTGHLQFNTSAVLPSGLVGSATIVFGGNTSNELFNYNYNNGGFDGILTLAPTVTIRGQNGYIHTYGSSGGTLNNGLITADIATGTIAIYGPFTNSPTGHVSARNAADILFGYGTLFINQGLVDADGLDSTVTFSFDFNNSGTLEAQNSGSVIIENYTITNSGIFQTQISGTMSLGGTTTLTGTGTLTNNAGTMTLYGTLINTAHAFTLTDALLISGGTIRGGTINESGSGLLVATQNDGLLDGVTVNGNIDLSQSDGVYLSLTNTITLNGTLFIGSSDGTRSARLTFQSSPLATLQGNATVLFGGSANNQISNYGYDNGNFDGTLIFASSVIIHGSSGAIYNSYAGSIIVNYGDINADIDTGIITIYDPFTNAGILEQTSGGTLIVRFHDAPTMSIDSSTSTSTFGDPVTFTITVTPTDGTATGTVTLLDGIIALASGPLDANGTATLTTSAISGGHRNITASYSGDPTYINNNSHAASILVNTAPSTTTLGPASNPSPYATQATAFTATVTSSISTPTGAVAFLDGTATLGTAILNPAGTATFSTTSLSAATHTITARYLGDTNYSPSLAAGSDIVTVLAAISTTTTISVIPNPVILNQTVTLTATVLATGFTPTGTVTFYDGTNLGTVPLVGGIATLPVAYGTLGLRAVKAFYNGSFSNPVYSRSFSPFTALTVARYTTSVALSSDITGPISVGTSIAFSATITSPYGNPSGTVTFFDNSRPIATVSLDGSGIATFITSALGGGNNTISANFNPTGNFATSTSSIVHTLIKYSTLTTLSLSATLAVPNQPITLTASVTSSSGIPTGRVDFYDQFTNSIIGFSSLDGSGVATFTTTSLAVGNHSLVAFFAGSGLYSNSSSGFVNALTISKASTTTTLASNIGTPVPVGTAVTFLARVASAFSTPTGTVTIFNGNSPIYTAAIDSTGILTFTTSGLGGGTDLLTAVYYPTGNFLASASSPLSQTLIKNSTTTTLSLSSNPSAINQPVTLTATVTTPIGVPTGRVDFYDNATNSIIGSSYVSAGIATFTTSALTLGHHNLVAYYAGSAIHTNSNSGHTTDLVINAAPAAAILSLGAIVINFGQTISITSSITGSYGNPTGSVSLYDGTTLLGTGYINATGQTTFACPKFAIGVHSLSVTYNGNTTYSSITSTAVSLTVN